MLDFHHGGGCMEDGRIIVTQEDIADYLLKVNKVGFIVMPIFFLLMFLYFRFCNWVEPRLIWDILIIATGLLCVFCIALEIYNIRKIKNGTYFTITTDELRRKEEHVIRVGDDGMRLYFQCDHYDIRNEYNYRYRQAYDMDHRTLFDTAFIGDSFTLVKVKKNVVLAYNNKLFDVQI